MSDPIPHPVPLSRKRAQALLATARLEREVRALKLEQQRNENPCAWLIVWVVGVFGAAWLVGLGWRASGARLM